MLTRAFIVGLLSAVASLASTVVEDSKARFVKNEKVMDTGVYRCLDDEGKPAEGYTFNPELAGYEDGNGMPFRVFRIAVPGNNRPSVAVSDIKTVALDKPYCKNKTIKYSGTVVEGPFLKDGLWMVDVRVPLYVKRGNAPALRSEFRLDVEFAGNATGRKPGDRAVSRVQNPKGAARFGVAVEGLRKALRREAASETPDVNYLAQILVGDKDIATTAEDGFYAISFGDVRIAMQEYSRQGDLYGIPVEKLRLYGAKPDTLSDRVPGAELRAPTHLFEIPIQVKDKQGNGIFDDGDSILFVGYGKNIWKRCDGDDSLFENGKMDYYYSVSPFSYYQYFTLGWSETGKGLRSDKVLASPSGSGKNIPWLRYVRAEKDVILRDTYFGKPLDYESSTGKEWFWFWHSRLDSTTLSNIDLSSGMSQMTDLKGLVDGGKQYASVSYFPHRSVWSDKVQKKGDQTPAQLLSDSSYGHRMSKINFDFQINGKKFASKDAKLIPGGNFRIDNPGLKKSGNSFQLTMLPNDAQFDRFDGYSLAYQWNPSVESAEWLLPGQVSGIINIPVGSQSDIRVMKFIDFRPVGLLKVTNGVAKDSVALSEDVRYLAYREKQPRSPKVVGVPPKQPGLLSNIAKINSETEYLIISPYVFLSQALQLGKFRSDGSAVMTKQTTVVAVEDIYRMYTGGNLSPIAIRNYIAYAYSVCPSLKFVLLVGSGHYDYKGIVVQAKNFMPPFEKEDAVIEDFFAALDSGELVQYDAYDLDIAVGRLPVKSVQEMNNYLNKVKEYEQVGKYDHGVWRSNIILAADDAKNGSEEDVTPHTQYEEKVATLLDAVVNQLNFRWNLKKVYLINYSYDAAGQKKEATNDFLNILNQGALITNYFGHGSKTEWAAEGLLKSSYISRLSNKGRYTILNSFSCTVARFDEGKGRSLTEEFLVASNVGSIASVGATRETFGAENRAFGTNVMVSALGESGITYGEAYLKAKRSLDPIHKYSSTRYNNERYVYLGEPVIQMPMAKNQITLDQTLDTLKALDHMKLSGTVSGMNNGMINLSIREGRVNKKLGLEIINKITHQEDSINVLFDGALLYSEEVPVRGGRFETEFVTPRKINFGDTAAEFIAWGYSANERSISRLFKTGIQISGMSSYADSIHDDVPPAISIQSCYSGGKATTFANSQRVKLQSPACLQVVIEDSTALDFREQADEGISFEVVGKETPYHPYPYLEQTSKRAVIRKTFPAQNYPEGKYEFHVYASDVLGNSSDQELFIEITGELEEGLVDVFNAPNPMGKKGTTFYFKNLAVDRPSTVNIFIYNQNGRLVKVIKNAVSGVTHWDGRDNHGRKLANGLYHYVVRSEVPATADFKKSTWTKKQKLVISR